MLINLIEKGLLLLPSMLAHKGESTLTQYPHRPCVFRITFLTALSLGYYSWLAESLFERFSSGSVGDERERGGKGKEFGVYERGSRIPTLKFVKSLSKTISTVHCEDLQVCSDLFLVERF